MASRAETYPANFKDQISILKSVKKQIKEVNKAGTVSNKKNGTRTWRQVTKGQIPAGVKPVKGNGYKKSFKATHTTPLRGNPRHIKPQKEIPLLGTKQGPSSRTKLIRDLKKNLPTNSSSSLSR